MMMISTLAFVVVVAAVGIIVPSLNKGVLANKCRIPNVKADDNPLK